MSMSSTAYAPARRLSVHPSVADIVAIDFEAFCLPIHGRSYPIEVGVADEQGAVRSWLIRPVVQWASWTWTEEAEILHGLTRDQLFDEGLSIETVGAELAEVLRGRRAIADSYLDDYWMRTLMAAAGRMRHPSIEHIDTIIDQLGLKDNEVRACVATLEQQAFRRHRAGDDARWLAALIAALRNSYGARERACHTSTRLPLFNG